MIRHFVHIWPRIFGPVHCIAPGPLDALIVGLRAAMLQRGSDSQVLISPPAAIDPAEAGGAAGERPRGYRIDRGVALLPVHGVLLNRNARDLASQSGTTLLSYETLSRTLRNAMSDQRVRGILFDIDSAGGEAAGLFDLVDEIRAASERKPIWAAASDMALSAAYSIAAASNRVYATRTADIGSVGVVALHADQSAADQMDGFRYTYLFRGARKIDGNPHAPLSGEAQSAIQASVDDIYGMLIAQVAKHRRTDPERIRATEAEVYRGPRALDRGLIDHIGTVSEAHTALANYLAMPPARRATMNDTPLLTGFENDPPPPPPPPSGENVVVLRDAIAAVQENNREVADLCRLAGYPELAAEQIGAGATPQQVRELLLTRQAADAERRRVTAIDTTAASQRQQFETSADIERAATRLFAQMRGPAR